MLPEHEAARVISDRRRAEAERAARDHGRRAERQHAVGAPRAARPMTHAEPDCRPCPPSTRALGQPG